MDVFDIIGPIMIGPSSSHTAGAVRIGKYAAGVLGKRAVKANIFFSGSFAHTYKGHGTDKAIIGGILNMNPDDTQIRNSMELVEIENAHPNTALVELTDETGRKISVQGASIGGGNIRITKVNDTEVDISGKADTILVYHRDKPGMIADITNILARHSINIGRFELRRAQKGGTAVMVIEIDGSMETEVIDEITSFPGVTEASMIKAL